MADPSGPDSVATLARCPWCSAELPSRSVAACPSCGAILTGEPETTLPGVTAIDAEAIVRAARAATPARRSRLLSWISGDDGGEPETPAEPGSLAPPPPDVRREMLKLEFEAEVANLQAEAESLASVERDARAADASAAPERVADTAPAPAPVESPVDVAEQSPESGPG